MAEEYILLSDLEKLRDKDFIVEDIFSAIELNQLPTHSFESFRENELKKDFEANLLEGGGIDDSSSE